MKRLEVAISSTRLDSQGDRLTRKALQNLVDSMSRSFIPVGVEHDPREPPFGRIECGFLREAPDGELEAIAIIELFDDDVDRDDDALKREIVTRSHGADGVLISYDWTHRSLENQQDIRSIADALGNAPIYSIKKSAEPLSIIEFLGFFTLGAIAKGFLEQVGADGWNLIKEKLANIFSRNITSDGEQLLVFNALVEANGTKVEIDVIITNPSGVDIDWLQTEGMQIVDRVTPIYLSETPEIRRLTFEARKNSLELKFAVRRDCRPLKPTLSVDDILKNG